MTSFEFRQIDSLVSDDVGSMTNGPFGSDLLSSEFTTAGVPVFVARVGATDESAVLLDGDAGDPEVVLRRRCAAGFVDHPVDPTWRVRTGSGSSPSLLHRHSRFLVVGQSFDQLLRVVGRAHEIGPEDPAAAVSSFGDLVVPLHVQ